MKTFIVAISILLGYSSLFSQSTSNPIGWRKDVILSYCKEYDVMVDSDKGVWVVSWDHNREMIKYALSNEGISFTETDSTIRWEQGSILTYEIGFSPDENISRIGTIIYAPLSSGPKLAESLKSKVEAIYKKPGKYYPNQSSGISYTWADNNCPNQVISMLSRTVVNSEIYLITLFSTKLSK
jgi:hypothetical protein